MLLHVDDGTQLHHFDSSDDIVRSVHLSADASRLALGSDRQGRGVARLYDANSNELLAHLPHDKPVWCVRLSNNGALLAVAGYDCKLTVYDCSSRPEDRNFCAPLFERRTHHTGLSCGRWASSSFELASYSRATPRPWRSEPSARREASAERWTERTMSSDESKW